MRLRHSPTSPFVRKVMVVAIELGLDREIERVPTDVWSADSDIAAENPLGKIPSLVTEDGIFVDSTLICRYLDFKGGGKLFPAPGKDWRTLQLYEFTHGIAEAAVACVIESIRRPKQLVWDYALDRNKQRIANTLDVLESEGAVEPANLDIATITLAVALGYLDFRLPELDWRGSRPRLNSFYASFSARPSMQATRPPG